MLHASGVRTQAETGGELCEAPARKKLVSDSMSLNRLR